MRAWQISSFGVDSLELAERAKPAPEPGEVLVRIRAVSLNYRDLLMVKGKYNPKLKLPRIPCSDGAGEVEAVGAGVTAWKPGDRVIGIFMQNWLEGAPTPTNTRGALGGDIDGTLAEYLVLHEAGLVAVPEEMSFEEAATLPCTGVTAWNALKSANLRPGSTVLIQGTGGVSIFALQLGRMMGMRVLGVSSSDLKLERARELGLDAGLNYRTTPDWDRWALEQTHGEGVDLVVEVGGVGTLPRSLRAVRMGGTVAQIGVLAETPEPLPIGSILHKQIQIRGIYVGSKGDFEEMKAAMRGANWRPVLESFPWQEVQEVMHRMEKGDHFGKLVLRVD